MMPVMDGWEFLSIRQRNEKWTAVPVIIISADTNVTERAQALRTLACLRKPIDIDELLGILSRIGGHGVPPVAGTAPSRGLG
jgi:CheY-like chemotaxis protein